MIITTILFPQCSNKEDTELKVKIVTEKIFDSYNQL